MRAAAALARGSWEPAREAGRVTLEHDLRHRRRIALATDDGAAFLLDLPEARRLRDGDGLLLEDGRVIRVVARPEPVLAIRAAPELLLRVAWHLGNRHLPAALDADRILIRPDHVIEAMLRGLGAAVEHATAPFDPEPGAYAGPGHHHDH